MGMTIELSDGRKLYSITADEYTANNLQTKKEQESYFKFCLEMDKDIRQEINEQYKREAKALFDQTNHLIEENAKLANKVKGAGKMVARKAWQKYKNADAVWQAIQKVRSSLEDFGWWEDFLAEHNRIKAKKK
jgi:predicted AAA+ superfamily ATPase